MEEELDPFMLRVCWIFAGFAMISIMGKPEFVRNKNSYSILTASLEFGRTYVVRPKGKHQATVVWLHEVSENGFSWYQLLEALPIRNIKWICPTAPILQRFGGSSTTVWFDTPKYSEDALSNMESLDASAAYAAKLLSTEPSHIKLGLGGFGMGSALALYSAACAVEGRLANGRPYPANVSAVVGLSGWLPMARFLTDKIIGSKEAVARAASLPLLLCHGKVDGTVFYKDGANCSKVLSSPLFQKLTSRSYDRLGHATIHEEMNEVCSWLTTNLALDGSD
ncbi:acyl-protein thioesterase 2-like [Papaver somniferum]|uniref:acyl-protein thioesterase 2-like n=1 Tax=Papaver somniferum TaxID=3469 RepID=UPI000E6FAB89|nr:acyl-protein thioesterase 2-like [Papaver somniferum]